MYTESVPKRNSAPAVLLRESYGGDEGKGGKRFLPNRSEWDLELIAGFRALLSYKNFPSLRLFRRRCPTCLASN
ncbi:MAG: hypothetical protein JJT96_15465 [Opitutales bacterium]|nr:hypothetical protein [Opitutales bacterium]